MLIEGLIDWGVKTFGTPGSRGELITDFDPFIKHPELLKHPGSAPPKALLLTARGYHFEVESYPPAAQAILPKHLQTRRQTFEGIPHLGIYEIADELANNGVRSDIGDLYDPRAIEAAATGGYKYILISMLDIAHEHVTDVVLPELTSQIKDGRVVLGGYGAEGLEEKIHEKFPTAVVVSGLSTGLIERYLDDHSNGRLKYVYRRDTPQNVHDLNDPYYHLSCRPYRQHPDLVKSKFQPIYFGTGCTETCSWCKTGEQSPNFKPLKVVERELRELTLGVGKWLFCLDQNLFAYPPQYLVDVFQMINDLKIPWIGEGTVGRVINNPKLMETLATGCWGLLAGTEDLVNSKPGARIKDVLTANFPPYAAYLRELTIPMSYSIVFGLDNQNIRIFRQTADRVNELGINALFHIATPRAGTIWERQLRQEGRLLGHYYQRNQKFDVTFQPKNMSPEELLGGFTWVHNTVFSQSAIDQRMSANLSRGLAHVAEWTALNALGQKMRHGSPISAGLKYFLATALMERDGKDTAKVLSTMYPHATQMANNF